ncbi:TPA: hypothetical protein EYN98_01625 [Candidatus Poribacteria bacterium]|nr:hypothetical protein [Candidatus Poribacteria bacterium]HIB91742.1 hypothetical protein [Candidatus Poribacteria bacterium]HIB98699.1 hypothetical protein [Candidatus Poribacteria bacterium]HIN28409.1 hypothetical protein [Candidatus Poribacteria bacterium]HIO49863.1 hypothetical protein [Candidatus Poribacteria bacterium]
MNNLALLVRTDFQSWLNTIRYDADTQKKKLLGLVACVIIVFALYFIMQASFSLIGQGLLRDAGSITIVSKVVSFLVGLGTFILIKDAIQGSITQLYEAPDTMILLSSSISPTVAFTSKLISVLGANLLNMVVWLVLPWIVFMQLVERLWNIQFAWYFYLGLLLVCLLLFVIVMTQTIILVLVINRFFSSRQVIRILKVLVVAITIGVIAILSISFLAIEDSYQFAQIFLSQDSTGSWSWYPQQWATNFLLSLHPESNGVEWHWLTQLASVGLALPILAVFIASKIYYRSWEFFQKTAKYKKKKAKSIVLSNWVWRGKIRSMMMKDFLIFIRYRGRIAMIVMLSVILAIVLMMISSEMHQKGIERFDDSSIFGVFSQVMLYSIMASLGLTWSGFKVEKDTWWILKSSMVLPKLLFRSKFLVATLFATAYANVWILAIMIVTKMPGRFWLPVLGMSTLLITSVTAFNTAVGSLPWVCEIDVHNQTRRRRPVMRFVTMILTMVVNIVVLVIPLMIWQFVFIAENRFGLLENYSILVVQQLVLLFMVALLILLCLGSNIIGTRFLNKFIVS